MPEICRFFGIVILIYYNDHPPPHFHARYGSAKATFDIATLQLTQGSLPPRVTGFVVEWAAQHQEELLANWNRAGNRLPPEPIPPL